MTAEHKPQKSRLGTVNGLGVVLVALAATLALAGFSEVEFRKAAATDAARAATGPILAHCPMSSDRPG